MPTAARKVGEEGGRWGRGSKGEGGRAEGWEAGEGAVVDNITLGGNVLNLSILGRDREV